MSDSTVTDKPIRTTIPMRIDRLKWSPFHTRMILGLGVAWVLDGLEITIASSVTGVLTQSSTLHLTPTQVGLIATIYLIGEVVGVLYFGRLSDKLGRRTLFIITLGVYLVGSGLTAFTFGKVCSGSSSSMPHASSLVSALEVNMPPSIRQLMR